MSLASTAPVTRTGSSGEGVPLDIPSLTAAGTAGGTAFAFATAQESYTALSYDLPRGLLAALSSETAGDQLLHDAGLAALFDIYLDQLRFARALIDLAALRAAGLEPIFDANTSPILAYLCAPDRGPAASIADIFPAGHGDFARPRAAKEKLRALKRTLLAITTPRRGRLDVIARGGLVDTYIGTGSHPTIDLNPYLLAWPQPEINAAAVTAPAEALVSVYAEIVAPHAVIVPNAAAKAMAAVRLLTTTWLAQAVANTRFLERTVFAHRHGDVLVGAAPKMLGRIFGRLYQNHGATVVRCAHGGERAFYDDDHWGLSELPFCDTYLTHGTGEAGAITRRYAEDRTIAVHAQGPVCTALGSARHVEIYRRANEASSRQRRREGRPRVMLAASSFLGEGAAHVPAVKPADVHLADLQVSLMRGLRDIGCEVLFKPHPKTMIQAPELFADCYDELVTGPFDPAQHDVDAYVFDYAGSAFFDALASARGVILVDTGVRPFDGTTFEDLAGRCTIVPALPDEANRFRVTPAALREAVEAASEVSECPEAFARRYFHADGAAS